MTADHVAPPREPSVPTAANQEDLRVEVVNVDFYLCAPLPERALARLPSSPSYLLAGQVPVVRVFGATPAGQKTCVHIHGLFPYFYFRAEGDAAFDDPEELRRLLPQIAMELERANELKQQQQQRNRGGDAGAGNGSTASDAAAEAHPDATAGQKRRGRRSSSAKLVAKLLVVKGMPFYGYHHRPQLFVQIFLYNPRTVGSVVQLLESGCIADRVFQPYEAHIPFLLQIFADYSIEGMNSIHLSNVMFRAPLPAAQEHLAASATEHEDLKVYLRSNTPSAKVNGDAQAIAQIVKGRLARVPKVSEHWFARQSMCALEVDVSAECILNRQISRAVQAGLAESGELRNVPSLAALWEEERQRRMQKGERSTPEFLLSVDRRVEPTYQASAGVAQTAASSLLSQSFFRQKMEDATSKIIEKMTKELQENCSMEDESAKTQASTGMDDVSHFNSPLSIDTTNGELSSVRNNTIGTSSAFSFSQLEHGVVESEPTTPDGDDIPTEHDDLAIMQLLLSMQRTSEPSWEDQVRSQGLVEPRGEHKNDDEDLVISDVEISDEELVDNGEGLDEIGDILASQRPMALEHESQTTLHSQVGTDQPANHAWWEIVDDQEKLLKSSSMLDLGSPRLDMLDRSASRRPTRIRASASSPARRHILLETAEVTTSNEDSEVLPSVEDLLPPPPPSTSRPRKFQNKEPTTQEDDEDSIPFEPLAISLTPQPRRRRLANRGASSTSKPQSSTIPEARTNQTGSRAWMSDVKPPTIAELTDSSKSLGVEAMEHVSAFYSSPGDIPEKPLIFSGKKFDFEPVDLEHTPRFDTSHLRRLTHPELPGVSGWAGIHAQLSNTVSFLQQGSVRRVRTPVRPPPTSADVGRWCMTEQTTSKPQTLSQRKKKKSRAHEPPTTSLDTKRLAPNAIISNLTTLSIEIHANSRGSLLPDPRRDRIEVLCYAVEAQEGPTDEKTKARGVVMCKPDDLESDESPGFCIDSNDLEFTFVRDEKELICKLEELVLLWDPDFITGFEVQKESIGFLVDRATYLNVNLIQMLSRLPTTPVDARNLGAIQGLDEEGGKESEDVSIGTTWGVTKASGLWVHGRFILNLWRLTRSEVKLSCYSRENIVRAVLKHEFPIYSAEQLTAWYNAGGSLRWKTIRYTFQKAKQNLKILSRVQLITQTSEMARLFGMDFYSVLSRGSQYRVESMMLRLTKRRDYVMVSPSRTQVARQAPMESIPLVMEPQSSFYSDPVVVLDFQSLYPSLVIAYNLCFSTIYGRLRDGLHAELEHSLGVVDFTPSSEGLVQDRDSFTTAPNGVLFSSKAHRIGVLPVILDEILSTRIMVKNAMKTAKQRHDVRLKKILNARQLALKMIANVTYGYTAAGFSGRMPCAQLADAIVQTGRCTLEAAVRLVEGHAQWNAKVVYGDTDSLFVLLRGRSKLEAFRTGQEIADAVTAANPKPVTLKLEKVYMGSILVSKKRYVGLKYESPDQRDGVIESKGIEVVRRDSCGVVQISMQRCLELLFATSDLSLVKASLEGYWLQMLDDQIPLKNFVFAKEVRLGTYARGSAPPAALVSAKAMAKDPRAEPRYAERVPYIVVNGPPGARLMDLVVSPTEFEDRRCGAGLSINYQYYIHKQMIPSLERLFLLMGANVRLWFAQMPRVAGKARSSVPSMLGSVKKLLLAETRPIDSFYMSKHCHLCGAMGQNQLCAECESHPQRSEFVHQVLAARRERSLEQLRSLCTACGDRDSANTCENVWCDVWNRIRLVKSGQTQEDFSLQW